MKVFRSVCDDFVIVRRRIPEVVRWQKIKAEILGTSSMCDSDERGSSFAETNYGSNLSSTT
jgi:hypothetical protein